MIIFTTLFLLWGDPVISSSTFKLSGSSGLASEGDNASIFLNPAIAENKGLSINFLPMHLHLFDFFKYTQDLFPLKSRPIDMIQQLLGVPLYVDMVWAPMLRIGRWSFSFFTGLQGDLIVLNSIHPVIYMQVNRSHGGIINWADSWKHNIGDLQYGVSVQLIKMKGKKGRYDLFSHQTQDFLEEVNLELLNLLNGGYLEILKQLTTLSLFENIVKYDEQLWWDVDVGLKQRVSFNKNYSATLAASVSHLLSKNISGENLYEHRPYLNLGVSLFSHWSNIKGQFNFDLIGLGSNTNPLEKLRMGASLAMGRTTLLAGWNQSWSYGLQINFWPIALLAGVFPRPVGGSSSIIADNWLIYLQLLDLNYSK